MEEVPKAVPNPLISWGIIIASIGSLEDNLKQAKPQLGLHKAHVGVDFPYTEQTFPAIIVGMDGLRVENSGFYTAELTEPREQVLFSYGNISIQAYSATHNQLMTIVDFISQCYLLNLFNQNKMAYPGRGRSWIGMGYAGGIINWSPFTLETQNYTDASYERLYTSTCSLPFKAEHHVTIDLARLSAIDIEAIPLNRTI